MQNQDPLHTQVLPRQDAGSTAPRPPLPVPSPPMPDPHQYDAAPRGQQVRTVVEKPSREGGRHGCLSAILWLMMVPICIVMVLRMLPSDMSTGQAIPEIVSFVPWLIAPLLLVAILGAVWNRKVLALLACACLATQVVWHAGYFMPTSKVSAAATATAQTTASTSDNVVRLMTVNTLNGKASAAQIVETVKAQNVEVLCMQEVPPAMLSDLEAAGIDEVLPYSVVSDAASKLSNGGRNGIWSAAPMSNVSSNLLPIDTSSMPAATIQVGDKSIRFVSIHPNSPTRGAQDLWSEGLGVIGSLSDYDHTYVVMGDFNSTWDHARFRELLGTTFVDASQQAGEGFHMTYPANRTIPPAIEIDHIIYAANSGIAVSDLNTVEIAGTDHMALLGTLEAIG